MISQRVMLIYQGRHVVATAQVAEQDGIFAGWIDLRPVPVPLQRQSEEYEEIVNTHMFSCLDAIEEQIEILHLTVVFADGHEAVLTDVQIYPSTKKVSHGSLKF